MKKILLILLAFALLLPGCTKRGEQTPEETPDTSPVVTASPTPTPTPVPTATPEPIRHPLTGEPIAEELTDRPLAIMINNHELAQPQCGIGGADMIYEILAEGGLTRMMLIVTDPTSVERFGTMRSLRPYYLEVGLSYGAVIVHAGGSDQAYSDVKTKGADNLDGVRGAGAGSYYYRDQSRVHNGLEHSLFIDSDSVLEYAKQRGISLESDTPYDFGLSFADDAAPAGGESGESIELTFGSWKKSSFSYDGDEKVYTMSQYGKPYADGDTSEAVPFTNLLILEAPTRTLDSYGRLEVDLVGEGAGYFFCGGKYVPITWHRDGLGQQFYYTTQDGEELTLGVGKTYVGVVPTGNYTMDVK
ncbi:MAG: DUF3048 domain-containing protein [Candidatus Heteroscillospira sp.]|jgi:hypothetical protein